MRGFNKKLLRINNQNNTNTKSKAQDLISCYVKKFSDVSVFYFCFYFSYFNYRTFLNSIKQFRYCLNNEIHLNLGLDRDAISILTDLYKNGIKK